MTTAQLPPMQESADRIFVTPHAVIMLDGASAFVPVPVPASDYADHLGRLIAADLTTDPAADLTDVLAEAIRSTATHFDLRAGESPSSTVTIARERDEHLDLLLLGDNYVILPGGEVLTDDRMDRLDLEPRRRYRERLAAGHGFDDEHRRLLRELQTQQARYRNRAGGYWIAETDPAAARHAIKSLKPVSRSRWAILSTDGAYDSLKHLAVIDWDKYSAADARQLHGLVDRCQQWERETDPEGQVHPRAKRHDDKTLAAIKFD
ncbi:hypothetical protein FNH06_12585 [Amycolatopsis acidiphila]|uniref:Integrase n=1 Tax=Amycolatopsis acidiphila TaxID=715473 RepID=A0A558AEM1_9PSEU|nr:hypothetical protein FNH06_12585 [Amycolatopsis acidiphila]